LLGAADGSPVINHIPSGHWAGRHQVAKLHGAGVREDGPSTLRMVI
jgi:hypothetical protein